MNLRCKAGESAVVLWSVNSMDVVGLFVEILEFIQDGVVVDTSHRGPQLAVGGDVWLVRNKRLGTWLHADRRLLPIRDPGEDATDEMVALLGKPSSLPQPSKEHA